MTCQQHGSAALLAVAALLNVLKGGPMIASPSLPEDICSIVELADMLCRNQTYGVTGHNCVLPTEVISLRVQLWAL